MQLINPQQRQHIWQTFEEQGAYVTPPDQKTSLFSRIPILRQPFFHADMIRVVAGTARQAKRGPWDAQNWGNYSNGIRMVAERYGGHIQIEGLENFYSRQGPYVFIGNHMSLLETFLLPMMILPRSVPTYIIKKQLLDVPGFRDIMTRIEAIPVGRDNPREDLKAVLQGGAAAIEKGTSVIIFPQSTRSHTFDPSFFNTMGVKLAARCGVPAIPLALRTDFLANGRVIKELGLFYKDRPIHFAFGEAMTISGSGKAEQQVIIDFIKTKLTQWGVDIIGASSPP